MGRVFQDADLLQWEAYATTGRFGFPEESRIIFNCLSDRGRRPRGVRLEGDHAEVERTVATATPGELADLLGRAEVID